MEPPVWAQALGTGEGRKQEPGGQQVHLWQQIQRGVKESTSAADILRAYLLLLAQPAKPTTGPPLISTSDTLRAYLLLLAQLKPTAGHPLIPYPHPEPQSVPREALHAPASSRAPRPLQTAAGAKRPLLMPPSLPLSGPGSRPNKASRFSVPGLPGAAPRGAQLPRQHQEARGTAAPAGDTAWREAPMEAQPPAGSLLGLSASLLRPQQGSQALDAPGLRSQQGLIDWRSPVLKSQCQGAIQGHGANQSRWLNEGKGVNQSQRANDGQGVNERPWGHGHHAHPIESGGPRRLTAQSENLGREQDGGSCSSCCLPPLSSAADYTLDELIALIDKPADRVTEEPEVSSGSTNESGTWL